MSKAEIIVTVSATMGDTRRQLVQARWNIRKMRRALKAYADSTPIRAEGVTNGAPADPPEDIET